MDTYLFHVFFLFAKDIYKDKLIYKRRRKVRQKSNLNSTDHIIMTWVYLYMPVRHSRLVFIIVFVNTDIGQRKLKIFSGSFL